MSPDPDPDLGLGTSLLLEKTSRAWKRLESVQRMQKKSLSRGAPTRALETVHDFLHFFELSVLDLLLASAEPVVIKATCLMCALIQFRLLGRILLRFPSISQTWNSNRCGEC